MTSLNYCSTHYGLFTLRDHGTRINGIRNYYSTNFGFAYLGDALDLCRKLPKSSVNLILTSPPFPLVKKKEYGNEDPDKYVDWFKRFVPEFRRVLKRNGSLVLHIGGNWNRGSPTKSLCIYELLLELSKTFHLAQDFYWYNPAKLPSPSEWVSVRRIRVKDAVDTIWWLSKVAYPKASNRRVLTPYKPGMVKLFQNGYKPGARPSGYNITKKFKRQNGGAIPPNMLMFSNTNSNDRYLTGCRDAKVEPHPARYPIGIPDFFIRFLTTRGDVVLDPFGGSNTTGFAAEELGRRWLAFELRENYLEGSKLRFESLLDERR